jgi:hypothetical protein
MQIFRDIYGMEAVSTKNDSIQNSSCLSNSVRTNIYLCI